MEYISLLQVLSSNAGYYVGHKYLDKEINDWLPYNRCSHYFATRAEAEIYLKHMLA